MINESANQNDPKRAGDRDGNKPLPSSNKPDTDKGEPFALERAFPEPAEIFRRLDALSARSNSVLIVLDANTLLLPYHLKPTGLGPLENIFTKLSNEKRLFVPARAVREFAKHRSSKLSDIISALSKRQSEQPKTEMPQFLAGTQEFSDLEASYSRYKEVRNQYMKSLKQLTKKLRSWNGDDPVSALYEKIFKPETIVEPTEAPDQLLAEWRRRFADKMPPGYKDGAKGHDAIGDFLIWKAILQLGAREKKGTIFVTGDEKADWFVRTDGRGVFPRPELIEEYRRVTKGHAFRLM